MSRKPTARLDHVGIAVKDVDAALAFYRDALELEVEAPEEVASQRVRAHFIPVGDSALELLEATGPESAIAKYIEKCGPGIHHITLRVDDIHATLARLKERHVRLVDDSPRPGAEGALVAFIHPSAAHGVLVELKQAADHGGRRGGRDGATDRPAIHTIGKLQLITLTDGFFRLDGGAMFGIVPRVLWEPKMPADERHRITSAIRPLIVRGERTVLIDAGCGDAMDPKTIDLFGVERDYVLDDALSDANVAPEDIDIVVATHLHFDHAGGFTRREGNGRVVARFPKARYVVHRGEWDDAMHPHERSRGSYCQETFAPLAEAGVVDLVDDNAEVMPGVRMRRSGGHTQHHHIVMIESQGETAAFTADMYPTAAHVPDTWMMGCDLYPMDTLAFKRTFAREAIERDYLIFFEHDPSLAAGRLREVDGNRTVERAI